MRAKLIIAALAVALVVCIVVMARAVDHTVQGEVTVSLGPGEQEVAIATTVIRPALEGGSNTKILTNAAGWWAMNFMGLTTPDIVYIEIDCDSCGAAGKIIDMVEAQIIASTDTIPFYPIGLWQWTQAGDSTNAIGTIRFRNPVLGDTTAAGNPVTMRIEYFIAD